MKEDFLHYIWLHKKLNVTNLFTTKNEKIEILNFGQYLPQAGPDFFNAQLIIENQKWAGNVEIHLKSSDWYLHNHEKDANYDNVILHIVWEHDAEVYRKDNSEIPVLELSKYVLKNELIKYKNLTTSKTWIFCENNISEVDAFIMQNWQERLFFERLERKINPIQTLLNDTLYDWEAVFFVLLAKNFGLNVNGTSFYEMAKSIPFSVIRKESIDLENLEALFFGMSNLLDQQKQDNYYINLQKRWLYLQHKYQLKNSYVTTVQFFKLRPDNFPTIRLAQLAKLFYCNQNLFADIIQCISIEKLYSIFKITASVYWENHYNFERETPPKIKKLSNSFIDLLIINTIIPFQFLYAKSIDNNNLDELMQLISQIKPEKNIVIDKFNTFNVGSKNAFETQSLLQLKSEYCNKKKCLQCKIGLALLKK